MCFSLLLRNWKSLVVFVKFEARFVGRIVLRFSDRMMKLMDLVLSIILRESCFLHVLTSLIFRCNFTSYIIFTVGWKICLLQMMWECVHLFSLLIFVSYNLCFIRDYLNPSSAIVYLLEEPVLRKTKPSNTWLLFILHKLTIDQQESPVSCRSTLSTFYRYDKMREVSWKSNFILTERNKKYEYFIKPTLRSIL